MKKIFKFLTWFFFRPYIVAYNYKNFQIVSYVGYESKTGSCVYYSSEKYATRLRKKKAIELVTILNRFDKTKQYQILKAKYK